MTGMFLFEPPHKVTQIYSFQYVHVPSFYEVVLKGKTQIL